MIGSGGLNDAGVVGCPFHGRPKRRQEPGRCWCELVLGRMVLSGDQADAVHGVEGLAQHLVRDRSLCRVVGQRHPVDGVEQLRMTHRSVLSGERDQDVWLPLPGKHAVQAAQMPQLRVVAW